MIGPSFFTTESLFDTPAWSKVRNRINNELK